MNNFTIKLEKPKTCCTCGTVHSGYVSGIVMDDSVMSWYIWFNCSCGSTLLAPLGPQIRTLIDLCKDSRIWTENASKELKIAV